MPNTKQILGVFFLLIAIHFALSEIISYAAFYSTIQSEHQKVALALQGAKAAPSLGVRVAQSVAHGLDTVFSLPLAPFVDIDASNEIEEHLRTPFYIDLLNSVFAATLIYAYLLGMAFLLPLSEESRFRRFVFGEMKFTSSGASMLAGQLPVLSMAKSFKKMEKRRYGKVFILGFVHLMFSVSANLVLVGERLRGVSNGSGASMMELLRLPLTPLFIPQTFWDPKGPGQTQSLVMLANSVCFAFLVFLLLSLIKKIRTLRALASE